MVQITIILLVIFVHPLIVQCDEEQVPTTRFHNGMIIFQCNSDTESSWRLAPGHFTLTFPKDTPGIRQFYSDCIGRQSCSVNETLITSWWKTFQPDRQKWLYRKYLWIISCIPEKEFLNLESSDNEIFLEPNYGNRFIIGNGVRGTKQIIKMKFNEGEGISLDVYYMHDRCNQNVRMSAHVTNGVHCGYIVTSICMFGASGFSDHITISLCSNGGTFAIRYSISTASNCNKRITSTCVGEPLTCQGKTTDCNMAKQSINKGAILGGSIVGGLALGILIFIVILFILWKRKCLVLPKKMKSRARAAAPPPSQPYEEIDPNAVSYSEPYQHFGRPDLLYMKDSCKQAAVGRDRPAPQPTLGSKQSLTITENDLYSPDPTENPTLDGQRDSAGVFIVENEGYSSQSSVK